MAAEELRHLDLLGHSVLADALKGVVFRHLPAQWQAATLCRHDLDLPAQLQFFREQRIARLAVFGAFVWIMEMGFLVVRHSTRLPLPIGGQPSVTAGSQSRTGA